MSEIVHAVRLLGFLFGARQRGQEHGGEDRDDGDDHEQFDQREAAMKPSGGVLAGRFGFWEVGPPVTLTAEGVAAGVIRIDGVGVNFDTLRRFRVGCKKRWENDRPPVHAEHEKIRSANEPNSNHFDIIVSLHNRDQLRE